MNLNTCESQGGVTRRESIGTLLDKLSAIKSTLFISHGDIEMMSHHEKVPGLCLINMASQFHRIYL